MALWYPKTVKEIIRNLLQNREIVVPVIQGEFVWSKDKIISLFQTLFNQDSFGGIMTVRDHYLPFYIKDKEPLFKYRYIVNHYTAGSNPLAEQESFAGKDIIYIIDGQQRISAFFIGFTGTYDYESLYFDLLGDRARNEFKFSFAKNKSSLPDCLDDISGEKKRQSFWISVSELFCDFQDVTNERIMTQKLTKDKNCFSIYEKQKIEANLATFVSAINTPCIGLCEVEVDPTESVVSNRLRIVRLFQKLK